MTTFSLAQTAISADCLPSPVANYKIGDAVVPSGSLTLTSATIGGMAAMMRTNQVFVAKGPDGALGNYTLDAERSTPTVPVLKRVAP